MSNMSPAKSPTKTKEQNLDFYEALKQAVNGNKITRLEWNNPNLYGFINQDHLRLMLENGLHEWIVTAGDLNATDWIVIVPPSTQ